MSKPPASHLSDPELNNSVADNTIPIPTLPQELHLKIIALLNSIDATCYALTWYLSPPPFLPQPHINKPHSSHMYDLCPLPTLNFMAARGSLSPQALPILSALSPRNAIIDTVSLSYTTPRTVNCIFISANSCLRI
jgi:hypothetical protein